MKKLIFALGAAAALMTACGPGDKYSVTISVPGELQGETVVLLNATNGDTLGSAVATDSIVTIAGTIKQPVMGVVVAHGFPLGQAVVEPGKISFNETGCAVGTKTNDAYAKFMDETIPVYESLRDMADDESTADSILNNKLVPDAVSFIEKNPNNPYNEAVFSNVAPFMNASQLKTVFDNDTTIANNPNAKRLMTAAENKEKTGVGSKYVDVEIPQADGSIVKLSDYITPGRYTIVDFWASWCNPCRREIPGLIEIYKQYKEAGIDVVGVAVWDEPANSETAVKELGINYPVIYSDKAQSAAVTDAYGVIGIPCILMIDPQGTIVGRDLFGEDITAAVQKAIMSKRR